MKLTILDGHALNPGDVSCDVFKQFGDLTIYDRTSDSQIIERIGDSEIVFLNKVNITEAIFREKITIYISCTFLVLNNIKYF